MVADEIRAVLAAKADALVRGVPADLAALIDPNFIYVNARGSKFDKEGYIEAFCSSGRIAFREQRFDDIDVVSHAGFAVATMTVNDRFVSDGRMVMGTYRSLCVFAKSGDRWLWAAGQTAPV